MHATDSATYIVELLLVKLIGLLFSRSRVGLVRL